MQHDTAMAAALKQAAPEMTENSELYNVAIDLLRSTNGNPALATAAFVSKVFAMNLIYPLARAYLEERAADMKNGGVSGHCLRDTQATIASASPTPRDDSGHSVRDTQSAVAGSSHPVREREAITVLTPTKGVPPVREPSAVQKSAAGSMRLKMAENVLQSFKVRDGRAIGKIWRSEISDMIGVNWRENAILDKVRNLPLPKGANDARVDEYVSEGQLSKIIAEVDATVAA